MAKMNIGVETWSRFAVHGLRIAPSLAGSVHQFRHAGKAIEIHIPKRPPLTRRGNFDSSASINWMGWWSKSGHPVSFEVQSVDVVVNLKRTTKVVPAVLERVDVSLFSEAERKRLDKLVAEGAATAAQALDRWLRLLRWQSRSHDIGRPPVLTHESGWGTYLRDADSEKRFYTDARVIRVPHAPLISPPIWRATGVALLNPKTEAPIWFGFLLDGEHRVTIGDLHSGIVSLAIACESLFRALLARYLPERDDTVVYLMNQINISRILDKWKHLRRERRWAPTVDLPKIKRLFDLRNMIAHSGQVRDLDASECSELARAVHSFVLVADKQLKFKLAAV